MNDDTLEAWNDSPWSTFIEDEMGGPPDAVHRALLLKDLRQTETFFALLRTYYHRLSMASVFAATNRVVPEVPTFQRVLTRSAALADGSGMLEVPRLPKSGQTEDVYRHILDLHGMDQAEAAKRYLRTGTSHPRRGLTTWHCNYTHDVYTEKQAHEVVGLGVGTAHLAWEMAQDDVGWVSGIEGCIPTTLRSPYEPLLDLLRHPFCPRSLWVMRGYWEGREGYKTLQDVQPLGWVDLLLQLRPETKSK